MTIRKIKDHTYVKIPPMGANVSCLDSDIGLILIDTPHLPEEIRQWKKALDKFNKDIACIINTHHHFDHCLGNSFFSPNVIAHELCYTEMLKPDGTMRQYFVPCMEELSAETKSEIYAMPLTLPRFTFSERMWLHLGSMNLELIYTGGHSKSSIIIYNTDDKILFTGDNLLSNRHPYKGQADFGKWIESLELMQYMYIDVVVPGHGEICDKAEIDKMLEYFRRLQQRVSELYQGKHDLNSVIIQTHELIHYYPVDPGQEVVQSMWFDEGIARLYNEIKAKLERK